jgi:serine/threonine protein kinase
VTGDFPQLIPGMREGDIVAGKYRIEKILGAGGVGVVVAARHVQLEEKVALKFLLPEALAHPEAAARFLREARAAVRIKSDHVVRVSDVGTLENGAPFMVMEYLDGGDLASWVEQRGALPIPLAVDFVLQACEAVAEAHAIGIIHRDLKPANLFCVKRMDGRLSIKVLDFGISKLADTGGGGMSMTSTTAMMGSPLYMSPEQMRSSKDVDARTDIWAFGVVLYELVTGTVPFDGSSITEVAVNVATNIPTPLRVRRAEVAPDLEAVVLKCLEKDRNLRYANVAQLAAALEPFGSASAATSVQRISGILRGVGATLEVPQGSREGAVARSRPSIRTMTSVGRTTGGSRPRRQGAVYGALFAGLLAGSAAVFFLWPRHPAHTDPPVPATTAPVAPLPSATVPPPEAVTLTPPAPEPVVSAATGLASPSAPERATPKASPPTIKVAKPPKPQPTATRTATPEPAPTPPAATTPTCTVVATYGSDGQPRFSKVCK